MIKYVSVLSLLFALIGHVHAAKVEKNNKEQTPKYQQYEDVPEVSAEEAERMNKEQQERANRELYGNQYVDPRYAPKK